MIFLQIAFPHTAVLGQLGSSTVFRNIRQYPDAQICPGVLAFRIGKISIWVNIATQVNGVA